MSIDPFALIFLAVVIAFIVAAIVSARRFVQKREREGLWDKNGPLNPTAPPGDWGLPPGCGAHRPGIEEDFDDPVDLHPEHRKPE